MGIRSFIRRKISQQVSGPGVPEDKATAPLPQGVDKEGFTAVLHEGELPVGQGRTVAVRGAAIALFHVDIGYFAIDDACTHEDAPLGEGVVRGTTVACPYHNWIFDIQTGGCETEPDRPVGCFSTKIADGFIWIGPRTSEGTTERGGDHADGLITSQHAS